MPGDTPEIIREAGFDFHWDVKKVWELDLPVTEMEIKELLWHLDYPFLDRSKRKYDLHPYEVVYGPHRYKEEYERTLSANLEYPIHVMKNKGRWVILDGLHRLMKSYLVNLNKVRVKIVPQSFIPQITK
jgi:hypothetical protein